MTSHRHSIQAVLVLYRRKPSQSEAFVSLNNIFLLHPPLAQSISVLLYDNSPDPLADASEIPSGMDYVHDPHNGGLLAAYTHALHLAKATHKHWLMLLDQDTQVTYEYLSEALNLTTSATHDNRIAAIIPRLVEQGRCTSPSTRQLIRDRPLPNDTSGLVDITVCAFNSGAIIRVAALQRIGGFPEEFPIESLDHAVFHLLQQNGDKVFIMQSILEHALSMNNIAESMSLDRYRKVLAAEALFTRKYGGTWAQIRMRIRLLLLLRKQLRRKHEWPFTLATLYYALWYRPSQSFR